MRHMLVPLGQPTLATFSGQLVDELSLCRVANQEVKDLEGMTYLIGCELTGSQRRTSTSLLGYDEYFPEKLGLVGESSKGKKKKRGKVKPRPSPRKSGKKNICDLRGD
ncbi:hypothetical protein DVH24_042728 [Malus domestica]|uniref:Uncharacterized protein n=1 Tax=Malus domestica TaxID=3750 RepID=A0A498I3B7_MALDO|nr:hypothetical protein DVH24_042728 [Malus domestica]